MTMKTQQEIQELKYQWEADPCWDIEETGGFEEYREELLAYRLRQEIEWATERERQLIKKANELGAPGNTLLAAYVINLETKLDRINETLEQLYYRKSK
jgi:hypothetical protein